MDIKTAIKTYSAHSDALQEIERQIKVLTLAKNDLASQMDEIEFEVRNEMLGSGLRKATISGWRLNLSEAVSTIVEETDNLPERFWRIERRPDLLKIKEALKFGETVEGARLMKRQSLSMKKLH